MTHQCQNKKCGSMDTVGLVRTTNTGGQLPKSVHERWRCNVCHDDFRVEVSLPLAPIPSEGFGEHLAETYGEFKSVDEVIATTV